MPDRKLILIDANSFCYRAFYAIRDLATSYGQPTNAVFGFINMLKKILKTEEPDYIGVCFDVGRETFRRKRFSEYKIHREPMPDGLTSQMPIIKEVIAAFNLPVLELAGYEADDVIATVARRFEGEKDLKVLIVSGDKDILQLVGKKTKVLNPGKEDGIFNEKKVSEFFGVEPKQIRDLLALMGDKTDNIPGITGVGEVTAKSLLKEFGSLDKILDAPEKIKSEKLRRLIEEQRAQAVLSRDLATLDENVPLDFDLESLRLKAPDHKRLFELFRKLEFKSFLKDLSSAPQEPGQGGAVNLVTSPEKLDEIIGQLTKGKAGAAFMVDAKGVYLCRKELEAALVPMEQVNRLRGFFSDEKTPKTTFDLKAAIICLKGCGTELKGRVFDCLLAGYLLEPARGDFSLKELCWEYLHSSDTAQLDIPSQAERVFRLAPILKERLEEKKLDELFFKVELPLAGVLADMELAGVKLDAAILKELSTRMRSRTQQLIKEIYTLSGEEFNVNSPKQLSRILFEKLNLPVVKRTKTGVSTDEEVLSKLSGRHAIAKLLLEYRQLTKLTSTYVDVLPTLINPKTGRLHTSFDQTGTETGRLSSREPNLQNIPIKTELGRQIRRAFVSSAGNFSLLCADYSQVELRILAHLSRDEHLIKAFKNDEDIHIYTAALIFNQRPDEVLPQMRERAKRVNFGIIYGMSAYGLAKDLNIPADEAQNFIDAYFARYPKVKEFCDLQINKARKDGFVTTILGRRRYLPQINSANSALRQFAERQAINAPVQGSAADLIKLAMIDIHGRLAKEGFKSRLILQVHDELVFDCPDSELTAMCALVKERMEKVLELAVPIKAGIGIGKNWLELQL